MISSLKSTWNTAHWLPRGIFILNLFISFKRSSEQGSRRIWAVYLKVCLTYYTIDLALGEKKGEGSLGCVSATAQSPRGFAVLVILLDLGVGYTSVFGLIFIEWHILCVFSVCILCIKRSSKRKYQEKTSWVRKI